MNFFMGVSICFVLCVPSLVLAETCKTGDPILYTAPDDLGNCPEDIQEWLERANACAHFEGEEPYDGQREAELNDIKIELQCDYISCDYDELYAKYERNTAYSRVLTDYKKVLHGNYGVLGCDLEQKLSPEERVDDSFLEDPR